MVASVLGATEKAMDTCAEVAPDCHRSSSTSVRPHTGGGPSPCEPVIIVSNSKAIRCPALMERLGWRLEFPERRRIVVVRLCFRPDDVLLLLRLFGRPALARHIGVDRNGSGIPGRIVHFGGVCRGGV